MEHSCTKHEKTCKAWKNLLSFRKMPANTAARENSYETSIAGRKNPYEANIARELLRKLSEI